MKFKDTEKANHPTVKSRSQSQSGFSLLEMLVAMIIFLIVTSSIYGLLEVGRVDRNRSSRRADVMKNARTAIHLIGRDTLNAGLSYHRQGAKVPDDFLQNRFELPADTDIERDDLTAVVAGNNIHENDLQEDPGILTDVISFASRDVDFNGGNLIFLRDVTPGGSPDIARFQTRDAGAAAAVNKFDLFMIETDSTQVAVMATDRVDNDTVEFAPTDPLGINQPLNGTGANGSLLKPCVKPAVSNCTIYSGNLTTRPMKRINLVSYKVKRDGTLVRLTFGNNVGSPIDEQIQEQPLAYNVKNLQFRYLLSNGRVTDNPAAGEDDVLGTADDQPADANLVTQVTVTIKVASTEADDQTGTPEVITLNATFSTRNLQYDAG